MVMTTVIVKKHCVPKSDLSYKQYTLSA